MRRKLLRPALWLLLAVSLPLAPALMTATAHAQGSVASVTTYYSDSSHTTIVGSKVVYCNGTVSESGTVTQFRTLRIFDCNAPQ